MSTDERPTVTVDHPSITPNLVVGICITAIGIALALDQLNLIDARQLLRFWPVAVILFGASLVVQALHGGEDAAPAGWNRRGHAFPRLFILIFIGLLVTQTLDRRRDSIQTDNKETVNLFAVMSRDQRTSYATPFRGGEMSSIMGASQLDLRHATIAPGEEAVIDVFTVMGGLVLLVPDGWTIDVQALPVMGGINDRRNPASRAGVQPENTAAPPRLVLRGFIMMGGLAIRS